MERDRVKKKRVLAGIQSRLAFAIVLTAAIPVAAAVILARSLVQQATERSYVPEIQTHLDQALEAYGELAKQTKRAMRLQARVVAESEFIAKLDVTRAAEESSSDLSRALGAYPDVATIELIDPEGETKARASRLAPIDEAREVSLRVVVPLDGDDWTLAVTSVTPKAPFDEFEKLGAFMEAYASLARRRAVDEQTYVLAFAALLVGTIGIAAAVGSWLSRGVVQRIEALAKATATVGRGDLSVRVQEEPADEVGQLGRAFNTMLAEIEGSRSRIEYLSRLASWQEMARRLAHEIKNPLTPIQLAVQEVHQRIRNVPPEERRVLDMTLEVVEAEVLTLRRLVKEFSEFARLPQSALEPASLRTFLEELQQEFSLAPLATLGLDPDSHPGVKLTWSLPDVRVTVPLDGQMMRRALVNLIQNAVQASRGRARVAVSIRARVTDKVELVIEDDGPGIPPSLRDQVFEPYVTTKDDGTGLGLAIVKKVVMDHQGTVEVQAGEPNGARFVLSLPLSVGSG
jgi:nitrogen fixation/metabolism regulation signal transduction histidine kinase